MVPVAVGSTMAVMAVMAVVAMVVVIEKCGHA